MIWVTSLGLSLVRLDFKLPCLEVFDFDYPFFVALSSLLTLPVDESSLFDRLIDLGLQQHLCRRNFPFALLLSPSRLDNGDRVVRICDGGSTANSYLRRESIPRWALFPAVLTFCDSRENKV